MSVPRSALLRAVLECLRDRPHDDTPARIAWLLEIRSPDEVRWMLEALAEEGLAFHVGEHWQLTREGWRVVREAEEA